MKQKLFNYFLKKAVQHEQAFSASDDVRLAALEVIFSKMLVCKQYASGSSTETIYFCNPKYAEELFLVLCADAATHGDNLLKVFNFRPSSTYIKGHEFPDVRDKELTRYLDQEVYPVAKKFDEEIKLYTKLFSLPAEETEAKLRKLSTSYIRKANVEALENLPEPCAETEMIDRAWDRLTKDEGFLKLFDSNHKHNMNGYSYAYDRYAKLLPALKKK